MSTLGQVEKILKSLNAPALFISSANDDCVSIDCGKSPETMTFPLYSVTKFIVAGLVLRLVERGRIDLDQKLGSFLSGMDSWIKELRVGDLLTHRSGLGDYGYLEEYRNGLKSHPSEPFSIERLTRMVLEQGPKFSPGTDFCYSNIGYMFLRKILEELHGLGFKGIVQQELVRPMSLQNTTCAETLSDFQALQFPTTPSESIGVADVRVIYHPGWAAAHGQVVSNASEALKIFDHVFNPTFIGNKQFEMLTHPLRLPFPPSRFSPHYGYGILGDPSSSFGRFLGHDGGGPGYSVAIFNRALPNRTSNYCLVVGKEGLSGKDLMAELLSGI